MKNGTIRRLAALSVGGSVWASGCASLGGPPLRIYAMSECSIVDAQRLGEYFTLVSRIEIVDFEHGDVVWIASAIPNEGVRFWAMKVCTGENPRTPSLYGQEDEFLYEVRADSDTFLLEAGREYEVTIWSPSYRSPSSRRFRIGSE